MVLSPLEGIQILRIHVFKGFSLKGFQILRKDKY